MSVDAGFLLDLIEMKLKQGHPLSKESELPPLKQVIRSFHKLWQLSKQYPELNSELDDDGLFRSVIEDISPEFRGIDSKLSLICDYCDTEFPLLNHDAEFSFQMHVQTPKHIEVMHNFEALQFESVDPQRWNSSTVDLDTSKSQSVEGTVSCNSLCKANEFVVIKGEKYCTFCNAKLSSNGDQLKYHVGGKCYDKVLLQNRNVKDPVDERISTNYRKAVEELSCTQSGLNALRFTPNISTDQKTRVNNIPAFVFEDIWIRNEGTRKCCTLCGVKLPSNSQLIQHISSKTHINRAKLMKKSVNNVPAPKIEDYWIKKMEKGNYCTLCNVILPGNSQMMQHINSKAHGINVAKSTRKSVNNIPVPVIEDDSIKKKEKVNYCTPCDAKLLDNSQLIQHCNSKAYAINIAKSTTHKKSVNNIPPPVIEDYWIKKKEKGNYCTLCDVKLPGNSQMIQHINSKAHGINVENSTRKSVNNIPAPVIKDRWIKKEKNENYCTLCDAKLPGNSQLIQHVNSKMHQEDDKCISLNGNKFFCIICQVSAVSLDQLHQHLDGRRHKKEASSTI